MKTINETFTDEEFQGLLNIKKNRSWREFILLLLGYQEDSADNQKEVQENNDTGI